jgi:hypothetical protein
MPVDNPEIVDIVGIPPDGAFVALTISDHLEWQDLHAHLLVLQEKLNRYFAFVEAGELLAKYPNARGKPVRIDVVFKFEPPAAALEFLSKAKEFAKQSQCELTWRLGLRALH